MFQLRENKFFAALALDSIFPYKARKNSGLVLDILILFCLLPILYALFVKFLSTLNFFGFSLNLPLPYFMGTSARLWLGLLYIFAAIRLFVLALDSFFNSKTSSTSADINLFAAGLLFSVKNSKNSNLKNLWQVFKKNRLGEKFLLRLGISAEEANNISSENSIPLEEFLENIESERMPNEISFNAIAMGLFENYAPLKNSLASRKITVHSLKNAALWVEEEAFLENQIRRWWGRARLARIPGIGKNFSYGETYFLEKFAYEISREAFLNRAKVIGREREIKLIEKALLRRSGANVLIVGDPGVGKKTLLLGLSRMISEGEIFPELENKLIFKLNTESVIATGKTKGDVEAILIKLLNETVRAGNIILAIENFPEFTESLSRIGVGTLEIFSPYFASTGLHIIALADKTSARRILEPNQGLIKFFERINIEEPNEESVIQILKDEAQKLENISAEKTLFSYPSIEAISRASFQNLSKGVMPKRAVDLIDEVFQNALVRNSKIVTSEMVMEIVSAKTKMPLGEITESEKQKLLNLEEILREQIIGQEEAVSAVANAVRRVRSRIQSGQKPMASFLFLGPTGVGKTETAKALSYIYFQNDTLLARFDMSEFQGEESINRLIGSFEKNEPGLLASKVSAQPYGVLLLDEFEKSNPKVRNLFLQVLDEGFFTDYLGKKINMRNYVIIATSNAGSEMIWDLVKKGGDPNQMKNEIISKIQQDKILSPELLNRFDSVIIFRPLGMEELKKIAAIALARLAERLSKENYLIKISDALIQAVARGGYDPAMGARPMQRFIQDKIEKIISEKIIKGEIKPGLEYNFTEAELSSI